MRKLNAHSGPLVVLSHLRVLANRLQSRPDTRELLPAVAEARDALKQRHDRWQELHDSRLASTGAVAFADDEEDGGVSRLARRVLVLVDGNRHDPRYLRLFDQAPSKATAGVADAEQARFVGHVLALLVEDADYASLRDLLPELHAARKVVVEAQAAQQAALQSEQTAWNEVQLAERTAREVYRDTHPRLLLLFPGRKRLVESFYPDHKRKKDQAG